MAEIAGLILGAIGISGLFSACIESFDIVVSGKHFSDDYEQLCALFSLQRARFGLWGESVGLIPNPNGRTLQYDRNLDRPDIKEGVERVLNNIKNLLDEASQVDRRYGSGNDRFQGSELSTSRGLVMFKSSFDRFKSRIKMHQKDASTWQVTRWALYDGKKFEELIDRLDRFVDGLESITKSLGLLAEQHARLHEEIEAISDITSLKLLRDASSSHRSMLNNDSDTSSRRFAREVAESVLEQKTIESGPTGARTLDSFITAHTARSTFIESLRSDDILIPGKWPRSLQSSLEENKQAEVKPGDPNLQEFKDRPLAPRQLANPYVRLGRHPGITPELNAGGTHDEVPVRDPECVDTSIQLEDLPQHQRLVRELLKKSQQTTSLSFTAGDAAYGERLASIKKEDESTWQGHNTSLVLHAHSGSSAAKWMFLELRNIRLSKVPFISAAPLEDSLDKVLASIEGPPATPYEGGFFFITVKLSHNAQKAPLMRFQTKIYHPNISPQGHICADYGQKWHPKLSPESRLVPSSGTSNFWYHRKTGETLWSLGALLTALCGLLAAPDVDDPLVPEIAQKYIEDYEDYCRSAKIYTRKYALARRPDDNDLVFLEDSEEVGSEMAHYEPPSLSSRLETTSSTKPALRKEVMKSFLASEFDDPYPREIYDTSSSTRGITYTTRSISSTETYASTISSEESSDETTLESSHEDMPALSLHHNEESGDLEATTPATFGEFFPSTRGLQILHDNTTVDGNMNLRVETEGSPKDDGRKVMLQLFHVRMYDLKLREFSLRRYCRDSGRQVCNSKRKSIGSAVEPASSNISLRSPLAWLFSRRSGSRLDTTESALPESSRSLKTSISAGIQEDQPGSNADDENVYPTPMATFARLTNTIKLEFSNYAQVVVKWRGSRSKKRYEFAYWGWDYTWKRVTTERSHPSIVSPLQARYGESSGTYSANWPHAARGLGAPLLHVDQ
ncbi:prion-inhibition and propagation-domain-containing protein [Leptodontidium sp. MPI-SDFR-AT-0119]|nr:prion-inhibition and propagation-domain-containing protein [Leptodontidium sp. MPI-SDFR-AT-0119]